MENANRSFNKGLELWLTSHSLGRRERSRKYNQEIAAIIQRNWAAPWKPIAIITEDEILEFAQKIAHYSASRWNAIVSALRAIVPGRVKLNRRRVRIREFTPPSQEEFAALLAECDRKSPRSQAGLIVRFLALTGLRIAEARGLRWCNVLNDRIEVPGSITKNGRPRYLPKIPGIDPVLDRLRAIGGPFVLPRKDCRKAIATACKTVGLPKLTHHCFRHLFATRCIESGVDPQTVARWLGHQDGGALLSRTYFHLIDEHSWRMAARVQMPAVCLTTSQSDRPT